MNLAEIWWIQMGKEPAEWKESKWECLDQGGVWPIGYLWCRKGHTAFSTAVSHRWGVWQCQVYLSPLPASGGPGIMRWDLSKGDFSQPVLQWHVHCSGFSWLRHGPLFKCTHASYAWEGEKHDAGACCIRVRGQFRGLGNRHKPSTTIFTHLRPASASSQPLRFNRSRCLKLPPGFTTQLIHKSFSNSWPCWFWMEL